MSSPPPLLPLPCLQSSGQVQLQAELYTNNFHNEYPSADLSQDVDKVIAPDKHTLAAAKPSTASRPAPATTTAPKKKAGKDRPQSNKEVTALVGTDVRGNKGIAHPPRRHRHLHTPVRARERLKEVATGKIPGKCLLAGGPTPH